MIIGLCIGWLVITLIALQITATQQKVYGRQLGSGSICILISLIADITLGCFLYPFGFFYFFAPFLLKVMIIGAIFRVIHNI